MRFSRRALGTLTGVVVLGAVTGCSNTPDEASSDRLEWLGGLDGVEKAELVTSTGDPDYELIRLTLVPGIPDQEINALVDTVKQKFRPHGEGYNSSIELAIDGYHGRFYPSTSTKRDPDVERALWLRRDGRPTSSTYGPSGFVVTAPPAAVAAVALGFDQVAPEDARRTHRVESADRQVVVQWVQSPSLGFRLDRDAAQRFADLQARYSHLTGWIEGPERRAGVYFAATDIGLDALLAALPRLVDARRFGDLELGWGPVRAPHAVFVKAFTPQVRMLLGHLMKIPGVTEVRIREDDGTAEVDSVTVRDRAGYVAAVTTLRKVWDSYLPIQLVRKSSRFVGKSGRAVFRSSTVDSEREFRIHAAVADLTGVVEVAIGTEFSNLIIARDIIDRQLATALEAMAGLPASHTINLYVSQGQDDVGVNAIGRVVKQKFDSAHPSPPGVDPALIARVRAAWGRAAR
jgi:hypothetical protein